jgi:hypothetical protein
MEVMQRNVKSLFGGRKPKIGDKVKVADGISLRLEKSETWSRKGRFVGGKVPPPEILDFVVFIAKDVALPIAVSLLSSWIYDKLKRDKVLTVTIDGVRVEGDPEEIKELLAESLKEDPSQQRSVKSSEDKPKEKKRTRHHDK